MLDMEYLFCCGGGGVGGCLHPQASCNDRATTQRWRRPSAIAVGTNIGLKLKCKVLYVPVGRQVGTKTDLNIDRYLYA